MKTKIDNNALTLKCENKNDLSLIYTLRKYDLISDVSSKVYQISYNNLKFLYSEDEGEILNSLNIIYPLIYNKLKFFLKSIIELNFNNLIIYYDNEEVDFTKSNYFWVVKDKKQEPYLIFIDNILEQIIYIVNDNTIKYELKITRLLQLSEKYKFEIKGFQEYHLIKNPYMETIDNEGNLELNFNLYGIKNREIDSLIKNGYCSKEGSNDTIYFLEEEIKKDFESINEFKDPKKPGYKIIINQNNYNKFIEKMNFELSEKFYEIISDRLENVIYTIKRPRREIFPSGLSYLVYLDKSIFNFIKTEKADDNILSLLNNEIIEAISKNIKIIYFNHTYYDISEIVEEFKNKDKKENTSLQVVIKSNEDKIDIASYKIKSENLKDDEILFENFISKLEYILYPHQIEGVKKIINAKKLGYSGFLLADDMGLGKTLQVLTYIKFYLNNYLKAKILIVSPLTLIENWRKEINKYYPDLNQYIVNDINLLQTKDIAIFIINYDSIITSYSFVKIKYDLIISDEIQRIKTYTTKTSRFMKCLNATFKIGITATPIENNIIEFWNIFDFLLPGYLNSKKNFKERYLIINQNPESEMSKQRAEELMDKIKDVFLRREKDNLNFLKLPAKYDKFVKVILSNEHAESYIATYHNLIKQKPKLPSILPIVQTLLQVCDYPQNKIIYKTEDYKKISSKLNSLLDILNEIKSKKEKAIVFTRFIKTQVYLKEILKEYNINSEIISGNVDPLHRANIIDNFSNTDEYDVLIINPKIGGIGLNLIAANNVIHYTLEWNYAVLSQATDRAYRIGQTKEVFNYVLYSTFTYENYNKINDNNNLSDSSTNNNSLLLFMKDGIIKTVEEYLVELINKKKKITNFLINKFVEKRDLQYVEGILIQDKY